MDALASFCLHPKGKQLAVNAPTMGQVTVGTGSAALSSSAVPCRLARVKAAAANTGKIYLGNASTVATSGAPGGFELGAGDDTGWFPASDLALLFAIASASGQVLCWWVQT